MPDEMQQWTPPVECDELVEVRRRRYREARAAGLSFVEARLFAESDQDVGTLRKCVKNRWTPAQIAKILN